MRTLTVDEVDAVSGAHPLALWAVAAYLDSKVTVTKVPFGAGAGLAAAALDALDIGTFEI